MLSLFELAGTLVETGKKEKNHLGLVNDLNYRIHWKQIWTYGLPGT